jgi:hypothetical protein
MARTATAGATETVVGSFAGPEEAKAAMAGLERAGIPTSVVTVLDDEVDVRWFRQRWLWGALIGAVVLGGLLAIVVSALWEGETTGARLAAGLGGAVAGAFVGGLVSVGSAMPRNPRAWDTYLLEHGDEVCIGVILRDGQHASTATGALRAAGATSVEQRSIHQVRWRR